MELNLKLTDGARRDIRRDAERHCEGATVADTLRLLDDFEVLAKAYRELAESYQDNLTLSATRGVKVAAQAEQIEALEASRLLPGQLAVPEELVRRVVDLYDDVPAIITATVALSDLRDYAYPAGAVHEPD